MAKTTYQFILLALVILEVSRQCSSPVEAGPTLPVCGRHASIVNLFFPDENCYPNCARPTGGTCRKIFVGGRFCDCHDGYIFLEGVAGDCVRPEDCPKQQANSTTVAN